MTNLSRHVSYTTAQPDIIKFALSGKAMSRVFFGVFGGIHRGERRDRRGTPDRINRIFSVIHRSAGVSSACVSCYPLQISVSFLPRLPPVSEGIPVFPGALTAACPRARPVALPYLAVSAPSAACPRCTARDGTRKDPCARSRGGLEMQAEDACATFHPHPRTRREGTSDLSAFSAHSAVS